MCNGVPLGHIIGFNTILTGRSRDPDHWAPEPGAPLHVRLSSIEDGRKRPSGFYLDYADRNFVYFIVILENLDLIQSQ